MGMLGRGCWQELVDLVLPADCAGCGRPGGVLCADCRGLLEGARPRRVRLRASWPGMPPVYGALEYAGQARSVLLAHKERGALGLARPLGSALAAAVRPLCAPAGGRHGSGWGAAGVGVRRGGVPLLLVPVPSARRSVAARGHDPVRRLARAAARVLRGMAPVRVVAALRQCRAVRDQSGLGAEERAVNLRGALTVVPAAARLLRLGRVVLVDDLVTTGATLAEAVRAVCAAGGPGGGCGGGGRGRGAGGRRCPDGWRMCHQYVPVGVSPGRLPQYVR